MLKFTTYSLDSQLITTGLLKAYISKFWEEKFHPLTQDKNKHLMLMCKVEFSNHENNLGYKTLGHLRKVNFSDKVLFTQYLTERLGLLSEAYNSIPIKNIIFTYIVREGVATDRNLLKDFSNKGLTSHRFNNMNLPISTNPSDYGTILTSEVKGSITRYIVQNVNRFYQIDSTIDGLINYVTVLGSADLKWTDTNIPSNPERLWALTINFL